MEQARYILGEPRWHLVKIWSQWTSGKTGLVAEASNGLAQKYCGSPLQNTWPHIATKWLVCTLTTSHLEGGARAEKGQVGLGGLLAVSPCS